MLFSRLLSIVLFSTFFASGVCADSDRGSVVATVGEGESAINITLGELEDRILNTQESEEDATENLIRYYLVLYKAYENGMHKDEQYIKEVEKTDKELGDKLVNMMLQKVASSLGSKDFEHHYNAISKIDDPEVCLFVMMFTTDNAASLALNAIMRQRSGELRARTFYKLQAKGAPTKNLPTCMPLSKLPAAIKGKVKAMRLLPGDKDICLPEIIREKNADGKRYIVFIKSYGDTSEQRKQNEAVQMARREAVSKFIDDARADVKVDMFNNKEDLDGESGE